ncbi:DUF4332 domain-containing protein [Vibrio chagasii]|nr:DUF4332 domain-containing protein [Vibrio chagasii]
MFLTAGVTALQVNVWATLAHLSLAVKAIAEDKFAALEAAGVKTVKSLADIGKGLREITGW